MSDKIQSLELLHSSSGEGRLTRMAWIPIPLLLAAILTCRWLGLHEEYPYDNLRLVLSVIFYTVVSLATLVLIGRSFLKSGRPGLLLLECGVVLWSLSGTVGDAVSHGDRNINATIFNLTILLAGLCHLGGTALSMSARKELHARRLWLTAGFVIALGALATITKAALAVWTPVFFIQNQGGTLVRTAVLIVALALFLLSAILLRFGHPGKVTRFVQWYCFALLFLAVGLFGIMIQTSIGGIVNWLARSAQWLGGAYLLVAAIASVRETGKWEISLDPESWDDRLLRIMTPYLLWTIPTVWRYTFAILSIVMSTALRLALIPWLGTIAPYNIHLVAIIGVVVFLGTGPALLVLMLGNVAVEFFIMGAARTGFKQENFGRIAVAMAIGLIACWVVHAIRAAVRKVQKSEARLSMFAEATFEGICESQDGIIVDCNEQFARMVSATRGTLIGTPISDIIAPEDRERVLSNILENREAVIEHGVIRKDGGRLTVEVHGGPVAPGSSRRYTAVRDVTERQKAAEALRESEERLRLFIECAPAALAMFDRQMRYIRVSSRWLSDYGLEGRNVLGLSHYEVLAEIPERWKEIHRRGLAGEIVRSEEDSFDREDGSRLWLRWEVRPWHDAANHVAGIVIFTEDMTQQKMAAEVLRESEERFRVMFESHGAAMLLIEPQSGKIIDANMAASGFYGYSRERLRSMRIDEINQLPGEEIASERRKAVDAGKNQFIFPHRLANREIRWVEVYSSPVTIQSRPMLFSVIHDITARRQAEQALLQLTGELEQRVTERTAELARSGQSLRAERQRLFDVLETLPAMICLLTPDHDVAFANRGFRERFGELNGRHCYEYCFGFNAPCEFCESYRVLETGRPHHWEVNSPDGSVIDAYDFPFTDADGSPLVLEMDLDITDHRRAEQELQRVHEELEARANQLRALAGELTLSEQRERSRLAKILHDHLQQLLVAAKFRITILGRGGDDITRQGSKEVEDLIDESIAASRSLTAELSPPILHDAGLNAGLQWLAKRMTDKQGLFVELEMEEDGDLPQDIKVLLFESVRELLFNVVKHARTRSATVSVRRIENHLQVIVADQGIGFDPAAMPTAGEGGRGFGLFSIRERIALMGGTLITRSSPGKGSTFILSVPANPLIQSSAESVPEKTMLSAAMPSQYPEPGRKIRVLLADDHAVVRQGMANLLGDEPDMEIVGEAGDGQDAVELAAKLLPDVILMDMSMPKLNGVEATRIICRDWPQIRIIGLSMFEEGERAQAMKDAGAVAYVTKSGPAKELIDVIRRNVRSRYAFGPTP